MKRRDLSALLGAAALMPATAMAQSAPIEGQHYVRLREPIPVGAPAGKIEVVDFFWYGCPHCAAFEPELDFWAGHLPDHVAFIRVPVAFRVEPFTTHQKIFYALESLGQLGEMHRRIFHAIHVERLVLDKPADIAAYVARHGVDAKRFMEAFSSFTTQSKIKRANLLVDGYKIDGVPAIGVHGRYYTSGAMAGGNDRALLVADYLIQKLQRGA